MTAIIIIIAVVAVIAIAVAGAYNSLTKLKIKVDEAFSTMDVYFKKRYDLIPNLVETVKGYAKHERETLENVVNARNKAVSAQGGDKLESEGALSASLGRLFALSEAYPELKADTQFLNLQQQLQKIEEDIANARKYYNGAVRQYNEKCMTVPSNIVAGLFHFEQKPYFEVSNEAERENVQVKF